MQTHKTQPWPRTGLGVTAALLIGCRLATAGEPAAAPAPEKKLWETSAFAGLTLARGNSETFLGNLTLDTKRKWEKDQAAFGVSGGYGEATVNGTTDKNTEYVRGFGQYDHLFSERFYAGVRLDGEYDGIAGVDYRFRLSPLAGYYFIKTKKTTLSGELGPSVVFENLKTSPSDIYVGLRAGEKFTHKLTETTRIWQSFEYVPRVDRWTEKYLLIAEIGIDAAITKQASLSLVFQDNYDSQPAAGRKENDLRLIAGVRYRF